MSPASWPTWPCSFLPELKASTITSIPGGMTNKLCIKFSLICPFSLAATEYGFECYCGDVLVDSWLMGGDSDCNKPRPTVATGNRDCEWAMSLWNADDGKVPKVFGPQEHFVPPTLAPGEIDVLAYVGGLRQTAVLVATPVYEWPAGSHTPLVVVFICFKYRHGSSCSQRSRHCISCHEAGTRACGIGSSEKSPWGPYRKGRQSSYW
uniref:Uncharacterized protein Pa5G0028 n=1 Tax=Podospora anserina TaxID=2587412 RepID=Q875D7_PODAS|nr:unnamed protein product [Podospora anserina]